MRLRERLAPLVAELAAEGRGSRWHSTPANRSTGSGSGCCALRRRYLEVETVIDFYGDAVNTRTNPTLGAVLRRPRHDRGGLDGGGPPPPRHRGAAGAGLPRQGDGRRDPARRRPALGTGRTLAGRGHQAHPAQPRPPDRAAARDRSPGRHTWPAGSPQLADGARTRRWRPGSAALADLWRGLGQRDRRRRARLRARGMGAACPALAHVVDGPTSAVHRIRLGDPHPAGLASGDVQRRDVPAVVRRRALGRPRRHLDRAARPEERHDDRGAGRGRQPAAAAPASPRPAWSARSPPSGTVRSPRLPTPSWSPRPPWTRSPRRPAPRCSPRPTWPGSGRCRSSPSSPASSPGTRRPRPKPPDDSTTWLATLAPLPLPRAA